MHSHRKYEETGHQATQESHCLGLVLMSLQLSMTYCVICLDLRSPSLQRPMIGLPGQCFTFLNNICFTFLLSINARCWLLAWTHFSLLPSCLFCLQDSFSLSGRMDSLLSWNRSFCRQHVPKAAFDPWFVSIPWPHPRKLGWELVWSLLLCCRPSLESMTF